MVRIIVPILLGLSLVSCNNKLAQKCAEVYPCKDSTTYVGIGITDSIPYIEYIQVPVTEIHKDSTVVWRDSVAYKTVLKYRYITRKGIEKIVKVRDTAKEKVLQDKIDKLSKQLQKSESEPKIKIPWWIAIFIALFGYGLYKTTKK